MATVSSFVFGSSIGPNPQLTNNLQHIIADKATIGELDIETLNVEDLNVSDTATITNATITNATITNEITTNATITNLNVGTIAPISPSSSVFLTATLDMRDSLNNQTGVIRPATGTVDVRTFQSQDGLITLGDVASQQNEINGGVIKSAIFKMPYWLYEYNANIVYASSQIIYDFDAITTAVVSHFAPSPWNTMHSLVLNSTYFYNNSLAGCVFEVSYNIRLSGLLIAYSYLLVDDLSSPVQRLIDYADASKRTYSCSGLIYLPAGGNFRLAITPNSGLGALSTDITLSVRAVSFDQV